MAMEVAKSGEQRPYQEALQYLDNRAELDKANNFDIAAEVADKIMSASSMDAVMEAAESGPEDIEDFTGVSFRFIGGSLRWSAAAEQFREGGTGYYAVFKCVDMHDKEHLVSTGATNVVFQLVKMNELGVFENEGELFPTYFTIKSRPTGNGTLFRIAYA